MAAAGQVMVSQRGVLTENAGTLLEQAVKEHSAFLFRVAYSVLRNHHDAEDAVQEAFIRVMHHQEQIADVRELRPWLAKITWRVALDRSSRKRRQPDVRLDEVSAAVAALHFSGASAEHIAATSQMQALLDQLIGSLPEEFRAPLRLSAVDEMNSVDIGKVLELPEGTVRNRLSRAREMLREKLAAVMRKQAVEKWEK